MAYNSGHPQGPPPYTQFPQPTPQYPQPAPQYPQPAPQYPQPAPQYPQPAPPYPQPAPQIPQPTPQMPQLGPQMPQPIHQYPQQAAPPPPSAPPQIDGYRDIGFDGGFVRPPPQPLPSGPPPDQPPISVTQEPLTPDEVKDALAAFVAQHCCYGSGPIKDIQIRSVAPTSTFKYTLETFVEKRETKWKFEPYSGQGLQTATGHAPGPWDVPLAPKQLFKDEKRALQVPHTESVKPCHDCHARGTVPCKHCASRGQDRCGQCGGSGQRLGDSCSRCGGVGRNECSWCRGTRTVTCQTCQGKRNLRFFVELTATWTNHVEKYVVETPGLPDKEAAAVSGETVCQAQGALVWPFAGFPESRVATASEHLVRKHQTGWPMARLLQQRHDVQLVPIHTVSYGHDGRTGTFYVCGREMSVFYPDYPSQCCGCCVLM